MKTVPMLKREIKGKTFEISITDAGQFSTDIEEEFVQADSLKELVTKIQTRMAKQKKVNIPFCYWDEDSWSDRSGKIRTGVILGIHGSNDNLLVKFDGTSRPEQFQYSEQFLPREKRDELEVLGILRHNAQKAFEEFFNEHKFNARDKIKKLLGPDVETENQ